MKKILLPVLSVAAFTLSGCSLLSKQKEVDRFEFQNAVDSLPRRTYSNVYVKVKSYFKNHDDFNFTVKEHYEYIDGVWYLSADSDTMYAASEVGFSLHGTDWKSYTGDALHFYKNPLGIKYKAIYTNAEEDCEYVFKNKYGYVTSFSFKGFYYTNPNDKYSMTFTFSYK